MSRRRFAFLATLLVAVNVFFWVAQSGFALPGSGILQTLLGGRLIRADIIWQSGAGIEETRIDRGVITSVTPEQLVLRERDGTLQTIPLATTVAVQGLRTGNVNQLRRGMRVIVSRPATAAATTVEIEGFGQ